MSIDPTRLAECRRLVAAVLSGAMTPESHRGAFEEDVVHLAARALEEEDAEWLLAAARDRRYPLAGRRNLIVSLGRYQAEMWTELRAEDPTLPPYPGR